MSDESTDQLTNSALPTQPAQAIEVNANLLPVKPSLYAAERITDVLPAAAYEHIGQLVLTTEEEAKLDEPVPDDEVDIRPDGLIYVSHEYIRRRFNQAFGRLQWTIIPGSPLTRRPNSDEYFQRWVLFVRGIYAAEALASRTFYEKKSDGDPDDGGGNFMSIDDLAEAIKSDCIRRCAKDLGLGLMAWNKREQERWKREQAVQVIVKTRRGNRVQWRRKEAEPFCDRRTGEVMEMGEVGAKPKAGTRVHVEPDRKEAPPVQPPAPPPPQARPTAPTPTARRPDMPLQAQVRMILTHLRLAGLLAEDDGLPAMEFLNREMNIEIIQDDSKSSLDNLHAMIEQIPQIQLAKCANRLKQLIAAAKGAN